MQLLLPFLALLLALALLFRIDAFVTVVWFLVGLYVLSRLWTSRAAQGIRVRRRFTDRAYAGDRVTVELQIGNGSRLPIPWLEIEESIPTELREERLPAQAIGLGPGKSRQFTYELHCRQRGYYELGPLRLQTGDLLGVEQRIVSLLEPRPMIVYPRVLPLQKLGLPTRSALVTLPSRMPLFEDASRIMGVREYIPGDSPRRIHWTATARMGQLLVKQYQPAIARETMIFLDLDLGGYTLRRRYEASELAIVVTASLASHMIVREGLPAGLATEARDPAVDRSGYAVGRHRIALGPRSERAHLMNLLEVLARVQLVAGEGFADLVRRESLSLSWGATVVVITEEVDDGLAETLLFLKRSGHAVAAILIRPDVGASEADRQTVRAGVSIHRVWTDREVASL